MALLHGGMSGAEKNQVREVFVVVVVVVVVFVVVVAALMSD